MAKQSKPGDGTHAKGVRGGSLYAAYLAEPGAAPQPAVEKAKAIIVRAVRIGRS